MAAEVTPLRGGASDDAAASALVGAPDMSSVEDIAALASALSAVDAANRRLRTRLARRLGLTVTDLTALVIISPSGCTPKVLAEELGLTSGTVTTVIDRLVTSGQAHRVPKAGDRRSILVELSEEGERTIEVVSGLYQGAIAMAMESAPHVFNRHILGSLRSTADALDDAVGSEYERHHEANRTA